MTCSQLVYAVVPALLAVAFLGAPENSLAQSAAPAMVAVSELPAEPTPQNQSASQTQSQGSGANAQGDSSTSQSGRQTKRILGIIPNFRSVSADQKLPPQSTKEKFIGTTQDSFDYSSLFLPVVLAGYNQARRADPEFGNGAEGYGRYLWRAALDQTSENYMVGFVFPVITHEDPRYYTLGHGGFARRTGYALSRAVITRNDAGRNVLNISEIVGAGAAAGISSTYYPSQERSFGDTASQWGVDVGVDAATFLFKEFWPDINQHIFHNHN